MPLAKETKDGLLQNSTFGMLTAHQMLKEAAQAESTMTRAQAQSALVAAISVQNILLATIAQAIISNMDSRLIEPATVLPKNPN